MLFEAGNGKGTQMQRSSVLPTGPEKLLFPSLSARDPADRNHHARHLDVIPTLIARFEGLDLEQAVLCRPARNSNYGATICSLASRLGRHGFTCCCCCCNYYHYVGTTTLMLAELLRFIRNGTLLSSQVGAHPHWRSSKRIGDLVGPLFDEVELFEALLLPQQLSGHAAFVQAHSNCSSLFSICQCWKPGLPDILMSSLAIAFEEMHS